VQRFVLDRVSSADFDLFIVDAEHVGIGFSPIADPTVRIKEFVLQIENQPKLAESVREWFDNVLILSGRAVEFSKAEAAK
jgi:hypothetical protein